MTWRRAGRGEKYRNCCKKKTHKHIKKQENYKALVALNTPLLSFSSLSCGVTFQPLLPNFLWKRSTRNVTESTFISCLVHPSRALSENQFLPFPFFESCQVNKRRTRSFDKRKRKTHLHILLIPLNSEIFRHHAFYNFLGNLA